MKEEIEKIIQKVLKNLDINEVDFSVEHPDDNKNGDYSTNVAMVCAKSLKINLKELAEKIKNELEKNLPKEIKKVEIAGPGFINFYLLGEFFAESIKEILKEKEDFGKNKIGKGKKILVEYSSPNIAKPFTIGHLRSTIIGDSVSKILEFSDYKVIRDNHLGDWGTQFGKMIVAIKKWGNLDALENDPSPIKTLVDLYVKFHDEAEKNPELEDEGREWFSRLEKKDSEAVAIWQKCISYSMKEFHRIYERLDINDFDTINGESFYENKMGEVLEDIKNKNLGKESEGAFLIFFPDETKLNPLMITKKDGSSLYALRDLTTDKWRKKEYGDDIKIINEVGTEQSEYFKQIFEAEEMLGYFTKEQRIHLAHGLYRFKDGKMSTRKGNVIWLDDIINEAVSRASTINSDVSEEVGIGAIKFNDLKRESKKDIIFDWEEIINLNGDSGPYLQYSYARAKSILEKAKDENIKIETTVPEGWGTTEVEKLLNRFPEIVMRSAEDFAPQQIANYLINLARSFNTFYGNTKIVDKDDLTSPYKLAITEAFSIVIKNGLNLLGIKSPEKM
ncbi:MAG: arginine--tRNA ligase [Candidatus Paceibacterota bacterium]|jgi:arginyl-tRNA synthetase